MPKEFFFNKDGAWYYAGIYKVFMMDDLTIREWANLPPEVGSTRKGPLADTRHIRQLRPLLKKLSLAEKIPHHKTYTRQDNCMPLEP